MKPAHVAVLIFVFLVLTATYFFLKASGNEELRRPALLSCPVDQVNGLEITRDGRTVVVKKINGLWHITSSARCVADKNLVEGVLCMLKAGDDQVFEISQHELLFYGLADPDITLRLEMTTGDEPDHICFGAPTPVGDKCYAKFRKGKTVFTPGILIKRELERIFEMEASCRSFNPSY